jgi:asparagine synthetase B (glutamine-hydrolysing)
VKKEKEIEFFDVGNKIDNDLFEFFSTVNYEKKKKKEKLNSIIGEIQLDDVFEQITTIKKKNKIKKQKENNVLNSFKEFLVSEKIEDKSKDENYIVVEEEVEEEVEEVEEQIVEQHQELDIIEKSLGLLSEPSDIKQQNDPLTPLDQKFALQTLSFSYSTTTCYIRWRWGDSF